MPRGLVVARRLVGPLLLGAMLTGCDKAAEQATATIAPPGVAQRGGKAAAEAIYQGCVLRFRPIMMTTMAALVGTCPSRWGSGPGPTLAARSVSPWSAA